MTYLTEDNNLDRIAVIGIAGSFPGANNIDQFWQNLCDGVESITNLADEQSYKSDQLNDTSYVKAGAFLDNIDGFDAAFFGFTPKEAETIDPQQRLFLESAWSALENAGYDTLNYQGRIGDFAGVGWNNYFPFNITPHRYSLNSALGYQTVINNDKDFLTTRLSYLLNLTGPSITIQTACSTSLVAITMAYQSLLNYQCDMALAGGVSISNFKKTGYFYQEGGILSPDGHCRAFDAKAKGTVPSSGVGVVVLKRLEDAIADRDNIWAVIRGAAINNDGANKVGYTAPSVDGQSAVIAEALALAGVEPETISYVEAHGTGTPLGDPIEIAALNQVFRASTEKCGFCGIGSVKTNIGHTDAAAGVAGFIKTVLALHHGMIPPSLHFEQPNPQIDFDNSPFYVNNRLQRWQVNGYPRRAGVSSFGIGGTNAHVVLEECEQTKQIRETREKPQLILLSAKTESALEKMTVNLANYLKTELEIDLADVSYTLQIGRQHFAHRRTLLCSDRMDAIEGLTSAGRMRTQLASENQAKIAFMFPGQGSQYVNMAREVYENEPIFRQECDRCFDILDAYLDTSLREIIYPGIPPTPLPTPHSPLPNLNQTAYTQPALFVVEYALAQLLQSWGIQPQALIGHSIGEYVAATIAGVFSLEDALKLVAIRGKLMQQLPAGGMLAIPLDKCHLITENLALAVVNTPDMGVVSGELDAIAKLEAKLTAEGIECRRLHTSHAFHSGMMDSILEPFRAEFEQIRLSSPQIPYISNFTGTWITSEEATNPDYWVKHLRHTVYFSQGLQTLERDFNYVLLEVGAGKTLSKLARRNQLKSNLILATLPHPQEQKSDYEFLLDTIGQLWLSGVKINWSKLDSKKQYQRIPLPTYPFEHQSYWLEAEQVKNNKQDNLNTQNFLWNSLVKAAQTEAVTGLNLLDSDRYKVYRRKLDNLCLIYIKKALSDLGIFDNFYLKQTITESEVELRYQPLLKRWLEIITKQAKLVKNTQANTSLSQLLTEIQSQGIATTQEIELLQNCGENLAAILKGKKEPLEFQVETLSNSEEISRENSPLDIFYNQILRAILSEIVQCSDRHLNILEVGGGTGIATAELLPILPSEKVTYTFTDVGGLFLTQARQKFADYPFVECQSFDLEKSPKEQGYNLHSFDVIIAVNALHVVNNVGKSLAYLSELLAPGGVLIIREIIAPQLDFDITDGLLMKSVEEEGRNTANPFLSGKKWQDFLIKSGFEKVAYFPETEEFEQQIIIAQTPIIDNHKRSISDWFYLPSWQRSLNLSKFGANLTSINCWLIFTDECSLGEKIAEELQQQNQEVILVKANSNLEVYTNLWKYLKNEGKLPAKIIHCGNINKYFDCNIENLIEFEQQSFYSIFDIIKKITENNLNNKLEITFLSNELQSVTGAEKLSPTKALLLGLCKVINQEYPDIRCRSIDLILPNNEQLEKKVIKQLLEEITNPNDDQIIAYRGNYRLVQNFVSVNLATDNQQLSLREQGVYLIIGGLGGIGLILAKYLAQKVQAKLVLIGRSAFPAQENWHKEQHNLEIGQKIAQIKEIESYGSQVQVISADVTNFESMQQAIAQIETKFGQIHGVIQAAGVTPGGTISTKTATQASTILDPKVKGTLILDRLLADTQLDFFILCSSLTSILGGVGMVDHCAANAFLDSFAAFRMARNPDCLTLSINWDSWQEVGQAANTDVPLGLQKLRQESLKQGILPSEGMEVFERLLCVNVPQILVSTRNLEIVKQEELAFLQADIGVKNTVLSNHSRPKLLNDYVAPTNEIEEAIVQIWQQYFGIEAIGINDDFFQLGGDSLLAVQIISQIRRLFPVELQVNTLLSEASTIAKLADFISNKMPKVDEFESILSELESLSSQEIIAELSD